MPRKNTNLQKALLEFEVRLLAWLKREEEIKCKREEEIKCKLEESISRNNDSFEIIAEPKKWTITYTAGDR